MKIACLQFAPRVGEIEHNIARAEGILGTALPLELDLLVLPELAFSGAPASNSLILTRLKYLKATISPL